MKTSNPFGQRGSKKETPLPELSAQDEAWFNLSLLVYEADQRFRAGNTLTAVQLRTLREACAGLLPAQKGSK